MIYFGDAIVKATRYESMRKILVQEFDVIPGHMIILQNEVLRRCLRRCSRNFSASN